MKSDIHGGQEFENIKCLGCGTKKSPLFMRSPPRHGEDVWCKNCVQNKKHL